MYADRKGDIYPEPGGGSSLKGITRALHGAAFFLYEYPENCIQNILGNVHVNPEEVWSYVMMQKDYQYRILICDRDDFAVLEMLEGRMIFPDVQSLEQFQQAQKDGGMEMI